jgi:hypothetical protein
MPFVTRGRLPVRRVGPSGWKAIAAGSLAVCLGAICLGAPCGARAQALEPPSSPSQPAQATGAACTTLSANPTSAPAVKPASGAVAGASHAPFPSDAATQPAKVMVRDGKLTIEANNSDLPQILNQVAALSGMAVKGIDGSGNDGGPRMFGVYGPGEPRGVLASLLAGSGYNFIMVGGSSDGPPRELLLTPRSAKDAASEHADAAADSNADSDDPDLADSPPLPGTQIPASPAKDEEEVQRTLLRLKVIHDNPQIPAQTPQPGQSPQPAPPQ